MKKCSFNLSNTFLPKLGQWENTELQIKRLLHFLMKTHQGWQAWLFIWACFAFHDDQVLICSPSKQYKLCTCYIKITTALLMVFKMRVTTGISSVWIWFYHLDIASDIPLPSESVFRFIYHHFHYFVNVQVLVQPSEWTQHHHHTSFSGIPCKFLLLETGRNFAKLNLGLVSCLLYLKTPSLSWKSFRIDLIPLISWLQTTSCLLQKRKGANLSCHCSIHKYTSTACTE